ncbi:MAG: DNA polymerase III subunit chi [Gammaproteobacteria bacterium]|nr:DNA polymerase III subunit chi [Gammaproteobacteria bacterium]MCH9716189.1 DNA polymerase III subunit chi [Gammaproteobacteria bacterium]MCH9763925.1 DNA polymerase III subunit chi [Gammaproteobacteria bacterium]
MRIDFYVIKDEHPEALRRVATRLLEKAYAQSLRIWVICANQAEAKALDDWLWTYKDNSFLPHCLTSAIPEGLDPPIQISSNHNTPPKNAFHLLLNLSESTPENIQNFDRILDLVAHHQKDAGRTRYKAYQKQQAELHYHYV